MTQESPKWFERLVEVLSATREFQDWPVFVVAFSNGQGRFGIELPSGRVVGSHEAGCEAHASDVVFEQLMKGQTTLQKEYLSGTMLLSGVPDELLRLAMVFDLCARVSHG